jgi:hypothetical protein
VRSHGSRGNPIWGIAIIVVSVAVIWALTAHGRDVERMQE